MVKMNRLCFFIGFSLIASIAVVYSDNCNGQSQPGIKLESGRYTNILIAIDQDVEEDENIIQGLKVGHRNMY